jgi:hypothetical protein
LASTVAGKPTAVEFDYLDGQDTAVNLASEMVEELDLSPEDATAIVKAISLEVARVKAGVSPIGVCFLIDAGMMSFAD